MAVAGFGLFLGHRLCYDTLVVLAALPVLRLGEQISLVKMLVAVLVRLDIRLVQMLGAALGRLDIFRDILGETPLPVLQVGIIVLGVWGNWGKFHPHTEVGLGRNLVHGRVLVRGLVLDHLDILGLDILGFHVLHHLH